MSNSHFSYEPSQAQHWLYDQAQALITNSSLKETEKKKAREVVDAYYNREQVCILERYKHLVYNYLLELVIKRSEDFKPTNTDRWKIIPSYHKVLTNVEEIKASLEEARKRLEREYQNQYDFLDKAIEVYKKELEIEKMKTRKKVEEVDKLNAM